MESKKTKRPGSFLNLALNLMPAITYAPIRLRRAVSSARRGFPNCRNLYAKMSRPLGMGMGRFNCLAVSSHSRMMTSVLDSAS